MRISIIFATFAPLFGYFLQNRVQRYNKKMKNTNKSVKKHQSYWLLLLAVLFSGVAEAKVTNYIGAYGQVGEWTFLPSGSKFGPSFGVAGGAGFVYELQAGRTYGPTRFLFQVGVGPQGGMTSFIQGSNMTVERTNQIDIQGDPFTYVYEIANRHDQYVNVGVQVPLMIGVQHRKFYMLAGVKVNANLYSKVNTTATVNTFGRYEDIPDLRNMPEYQFFTDFPLKGSAKANISNLGLDLSLEMGGRFGGVITDAVGFDVPKRKIEYRLAGYVDYGLMDMHTKRDLPGFTAPDTYDRQYGKQTMMDNLRVNDIMSTPNFAAKVTNLVVGIKFTVLFQLPEEGKCVICRDAYGSSVRRGGGSRGMKYEE